MPSLINNNKIKSFLSFSLNKDIRHLASTGGFCKEFIRYMIEKEYVDKAIITVLGDNDKALIPKTIITEDISAILSVKSNTIYDRTNPFSIIDKLDNNKRYILVGLPCHIPVFKKISKERNISIFALSLLCNHTPKKYFETALQEANIKKEDVCHFEYRGHGWPGYVCIKTKSGKNIKISHKEIWKKYMRENFDMMPRCRYCHNVLSYEADICVGDAWIKEISQKDKEGTNLVISMNCYAEHLIRECSEDKRIYLKDIKNDYIIEFEQKIKKQRSRIWQQ